MDQYLPKVSVIIPVYNAEKYLRECLDSVINQTLKDIEIICVDDGSTDNSLEILREYEAKDERVKVLTQKNQFAGVARNHGMDVARGEYYAFMDADDYYVLDALENLYVLSEKHQLDYVKASYFNIEPGKAPYDTPYSSNAGVSKEAFCKVLSCPADLKELIYFSDVAWSGLYRAQFLKGNSIVFNHFRVINDHSFFVECFVHAGRAMVVDLHIVYHRVNQKDSLIGTKSRSFQCQIDNYALVKEAVRCFPLMQRRLILRREIDGVLHWYYLLRPGAEAPYAEQMDELIRSFIRDYDENDVGIQHLLKMHHSDLYYKIKGELFRERPDPRYPCTVSVIIPVYNVEDYLRECLDSVVNQTLRDIEIICVDDGSTDGSPAILREYEARDARIKVLTQENQFVGAAKNRGLDIARGKYIWFVDSDDWIDQDAVAFLVDKMEELRDVDLLSFNGTAFLKENGVCRATKDGEITRRWPKNRKLFLPRQAEMIPPSSKGHAGLTFQRDHLSIPSVSGRTSFLRMQTLPLMPLPPQASFMSSTTLPITAAFEMIRQRAPGPRGITEDV